MSEKLTIIERDDLRKLKSVVTTGEKAFITAGNALIEIRDRKLYREECDTFEEFCFKTWNWKRAHAYRIINAAATVKMSPMGDKITNERQARALANVPADKHLEVFQAASVSGPATGKSIAAAAKPIARTIDMDKEGFPIPADCAPLWKRRDEVQELLTTLSKIKSLIESSDKEKDPLYAECNFSTIAADLTNARRGIERALPYSICHNCWGKLPAKCAICNGRGLISKFMFDRVPSEIKMMAKTKITK